MRRCTGFTLGGSPHGHEAPARLPLGLLMDLTVRLAELVLAAWVGARWLSEPVRQLGAAARALGRNSQCPAMPAEESRECRQATRVFKLDAQ